MRFAYETSLLYQALGTPLGLVVRVSDFDLARNKLYSARKEAADPDLEIIQLRRSPYEANTIWIVKSRPIPSQKGAA